MKNSAQVFIIILLLFCCITSVSKNKFIISSKSGLHINTLKAFPDKVFPLGFLGADFCYQMIHVKKLSPKFSFSLESNGIRYKITDRVRFNNSQLQTSFNFSIALYQKKSFKFFYGIFAKTIVSNNSSFVYINYNGAASYATLENIDEFIKKHARKLNAGLSFQVDYSPTNESLKQLVLHFTLQQYVAKEYNEKLFIGKLEPYINYKSNGINPLLTTLNLGIGYSF